MDICTDFVVVRQLPESIGRGAPYEIGAPSLPPNPSSGAAWPGLCNILGPHCATRSKNCATRRSGGAGRRRSAKTTQSSYESSSAVVRKAGTLIFVVPALESRRVVPPAKCVLGVGDDAFRRAMDLHRRVAVSLHTRTQDALLATKVFTVLILFTHLRAHETVLDLVCRLLLEKKKKK